MSSRIPTRFRARSSGCSGGSAFLSGRLFVVGDVKQSIYRFRGAEPSIFRDWRSEFPANGRLSLTENFRSVPGVIHFVNALFGDSFGDVDPGDNRLLPIRREDTNQPTVEFLWPAPLEEDEGGDVAKRSAHERRMIEARCLARAGCGSGSTRAGRSSIGR